ncbi:MAG: hypothetical protein CW691_05275 [Candidatus Bathyarchaeum sp.]|nr:MAG: hypothetical protein CW691_05275 [Candidatus Bathyarchaeum sp.]
MSEPLSKFVEGFSKNQLVAYFLLLWAATFFFSSISGFSYIAAGYSSGLDLVVDVLWNLTDLGITAILGMLGLKILNNQE